MSTAISIVDVSKQYTLSRGNSYIALRDVISSAVKNIFHPKGHKEKFWALKDIDLNIKEGERVGIIGHNGAGKSTLLKIISRITPPTTGSITLYGRVASLLEVGTGFHPELTGRENIYLNGSILGLKRTEINNRLDEIIEFSGVETFIDTPLKHYSSGMQLRLAFSVAAHLEPEILLIDEVLAVGDMEFQKKCIGKMEEVSKQHGRTIMFVSHNLQQLKTLCNKGVLLQHGKLLYEGAINDCIYKYHKLAITDNHASWKAIENKQQGFIAVYISNKHGRLISGPISVTDEIHVTVRLQTATEIKNSLLAVRISNMENIPVFTTTNGDITNNFPVLNKGEHTYDIVLPVHLLVPGQYSLIIAWFIPGFKEIDHVNNKLSFILEDDSYPGHVLKDGRLGLLNHPLTWNKINS